MAMPRGLLLGSVSEILGVPVEEEKRTVMGVEGEVKCGAEEREETVGVGVKVPVKRWPFAWAVEIVLVYVHGALSMMWWDGESTWTKAGMRPCGAAKCVYEAVARLYDFAVC